VIALAPPAVHLARAPVAERAARCYGPTMVAERSEASIAMDRYAEGDASAFAVIYDALAPRLAAYLRRRLRSAAAVDDALQHTFLKLHLHRGNFTKGARVEPWAYAIARGAAVDLGRRASVRREGELDPELHEAEGAGADDGLLLGELSDALRAELAALSPKLREAFVLVRVEGLSHAEAAEVLGIEESATKVRAHRAGQWLRDKLSRFLEPGRP
jgi:RNA polymerase sigma-70 factor, ECF subfamily